MKHSNLFKMEEVSTAEPHPPPDRREIIDVSPEEFEESQRFIQSEDAIMDDSVFSHIRKVISYKYREAAAASEDGSNSVNNGDSREKHSECLAELNTTVLNTLVDNYVGYAWLCEVCARWIEELNMSNSHYLTTHALNDRVDGGVTSSIGTQGIILEALMNYLTQKYDSEKMRVYMEDKGDHGKWNPPELYWTLMKSPLVVSHMIKIYHERPKDEFLSSWYQDYINNASTNMKMSHSDIDLEGLSRITSNFSVFTLRMSEEIRRFLLKDDILDSTELDNNTPLSPLFWHAENAYIYSQALLHFIYQWRIDLRGCRRLSQLVARTTMNPVSGLFPDLGKIDGKLCEWSASQIHLLMTNFARFPNLHSAFKRLCSNHHISSFKLNELDVCDFYDELNKILNAFDSYGVLLFDQSRESVPKDRAGQMIVSDDVDESVSQYGDTSRNDEYMRLRNAPEMPPLEAIRESDILNQLIEDFANEDVTLPDSNTWIRYANLLVLLSVYSPYEMLYFHYDDLVCDHMKRLPQREVWKQFYLPDSDGDSSLDDIEHMRDYGVGSQDDSYDEEGESSAVYSTDPQSATYTPNAESDYSLSDDVNDLEDGESGVNKAWRRLSIQSQSSGSMGQALSSIISSSDFESDVNNNMELESTSSYYGGKVRLVPSDPPLSDPDKRHIDTVAGDMVTSRIKRARKSDILPSDIGDDELLEIKSTLASAIYKNMNEDSRLGAPKNISAERLYEMKEIYASFKVQSDKVKAIARKELYHLYKVIHTPSMKPHQRDLEMRDVISTVIASSVVMAYIRHSVVKQRSIAALCNFKLLLLKEIADKHTVKRMPIALFLRDVCIACAEGKLGSVSSAVKLDRLECIVDLLVYLTRFERQCVLVVSIFNSFMHQMDRSISRHFISMLLRYCGAPYGNQFVYHVLKLVENYLSLGTTGTSNVLNANEANVINNYVRPFLDECAQTWSSNSTMAPITRRCESLLKTQSL
ncbi:TH1 family protein [Babesia bovis T2Bo]|uniref:TH1 family protein n=1 Tax=Babesia bovis T2Bo TaxID=484906 RepID=UPI001C355C46|nr:TH1 family protein [Babesia bovis T2Bo]EDO06396.2 TH1 family protein [Babesia bovis T2Bo]